jgi:alpha 1,3-glucosidase
MFFDPFTLVVAPDSNGKAEGILYLDDEHSLAHETVGAFAVRLFSFESLPNRSVLRCSAASSNAAVENPYQAPNTVERVVLAGQSRSPSFVTLTVTNNEASGTTKSGLSFGFDDSKGVITIRKPNTKVSEQWTIEIGF